MKSNPKKNSCYIIAEIGVNHNGDIDLAKRMILSAKENGANAVKFQTFTANALVTRETKKVRYQEETTSPSESHYEMIRKLEFSRENHQIAFEYCNSLNIDFISTPYDLESIDYLRRLGVKIFKSSSADLVDLPLQQALAKTGNQIIIATGMANLGEIDTVVKIYRQIGNNDFTLLHCVSNYPCSDSSLNLRVLNTLSSAFHVDVGFSDHSIGSQAAVIAVSLGAKIIEKHFTLDKNLPGPDQRASSSPDEFKHLVTAIRRAEIALGSPIKRCQPEEKQMAEVSRKSITLTKDTYEGETLTPNHLTMKRPGTGICAAYIPTIVGRTIKSKLPKDYQLRWTDIND